MAENISSSKGQQKGQRYRLHLTGYKAGDERPKIAISVMGREGKSIHVAQVDAEGGFDIPASALKEATRILVGPRVEDAEEVDPDTVLRYRPAQFEALLKDGVIYISQSIWEKWRLFITCVTGTVKLCRRSPWWFAELSALATAPVLERKLTLADRRVSLQKASISQIGPAKSLPELIAWPFHCQDICNGTVEVYRRTCCCQPWVIDDPRLPDLIRELEEIIHKIHLVVPFPHPVPNPPDPGPFLEQAFFKEGALDEKALNAQRDLAALRSLSKTHLVDYINAREYLLCRGYSCGTPHKVAQGFINPDGRFNICWLDWPRVQLGICHDEYAYIVKQKFGPFMITVYNGVAANIWFAQHDDASLTSYSALAYACRDNGEPGSGAYVFLDLVGDTESWNLKTPNATGWDRVAAPAYNDGLVFPAASPAAALGANLNRNWGGTLKLNYKFSEDMKGLGAKYYRISITEADGSGAPTGTRNFLTDVPAWEKSVPDGMGGVDIVPVTLGPFSQGGQDSLYLIPYDADADWNAGQYHGFLNTTDARWSDPTKRHLVTVEVFDATGKRLRPIGSPATGLPGSEGTAAFTFRRRFQDIGPTADVPFAALTHMFWWDNQALDAEIIDLRQDGALFNEECLFLHGSGSSTFGIGYRAYHPNEMFQLAHSITWQRGLGLSADAYGALLASSSVNVGQPPNPPGASPTNTFDQMLRPDLDPTRTKCAFAVFLSISSKTTDGDYLGNYGITDTGAFAIEIS